MPTPEAAKLQCDERTAVLYDVLVFVWGGVVRNVDNILRGSQGRFMYSFYMRIFYEFAPKHTGPTNGRAGHSVQLPARLGDKMQC